MRKRRIAPHSGRLFVLLVCLVVVVTVSSCRIPGMQLLYMGLISQMSSHTDFVCASPPVCLPRVCLPLTLPPVCLSRRHLSASHARSRRSLPPRSLDRPAASLCHVARALPAHDKAPGTRPNISEFHSEISTRVPFCIATAREGRPLTRGASTSPRPLGLGVVSLMIVQPGSFSRPRLAMKRVSFCAAWLRPLRLQPTFAATRRAP